MRLIDADELKQKIKVIRSVGGGELRYITEADIDNVPTVDSRIEYGTDGQPYRLFMSGGQVVPDTLQGWRYEERPQGECDDETNN